MIAEEIEGHMYKKHNSITEKSYKDHFRSISFNTKSNPDLVRSLRSGELCASEFVHMSPSVSVEVQSPLFALHFLKVKLIRLSVDFLGHG